MYSSKITEALRYNAVEKIRLGLELRYLDKECERHLKGAVCNSIATQRRLGRVLCSVKSTVIL